MNEEQNKTASSGENKSMTMDRIESRYGTFYCLSGNDTISNALRTYGEWAQHEIDILSQFISSGDTVIDIGSCFGTHAVAFASQVGPEGEVFAFEPLKRNFDILSLNAAESGREPIKCINNAISEKHGVVTMSVEPNNSGGSHLTVDSETGSVEVASITLDSFDLERVDFVKMDVEGQEYSVIRGAVSTISKMRPTLFLEVNCVSDGIKVLDEMAPLNYTCFGLNSPAFNPGNFFESSDDIYNGGSECGLLFIASDRAPQLVATAKRLGLPQIESADDLALLLLQKPQYRYGYLAHIPSAEKLPQPFKAEQDIFTADRSLQESKIAILEDEIKALREDEIKALREDEIKALREEVELIKELRVNETQDILELLHRLEDAHRISIKIARKIRKFPFSLYFKVSKRYRRMGRKVIQSDGLLHETIARVTGQQVRHSPEELLEKYTACKGDFDRDFYLLKYPDVAEAEVDPLRHYLEAGWKEGRAPAPWFDSEYYLESNPCLRRENEIPFVHYIKHGRPNGSPCRHPGGHMFKNISALSEAPEKEIAVQPECTLTSEDLVKALRTAGVEKIGSYFLSFSHSNWLDEIGGTEICIQIEAEACRKLDLPHLSVFPVTRLKTLAPQSASEGSVHVGVLLNEDQIGVAEYGTISKALAALAVADITAQTTIHQLCGHLPEAVTKVIQSTGTPACRVFLHDYLLICEQWNLMRNEVEFCGGPAPESGACNVCHFGSTRKEHLSRMRKLFEALRVKLVAPSQAALEVWEGATDLRGVEVMVIPHIELEQHLRSEIKPIPDDRVIKIGFVGAAVFKKGWEAFEELVLAYGKDPRFEFHYFGMHEPPLALVRHPVRVTAQERDAMSKAVAAADMDFIVHFAPWPETFSLTAFESLATGAFVLTNQVSGNVAAVVRERGCGKVFTSSEELVPWIDSDDFKEVLHRCRRDREKYEIGSQYSDMAVNSPVRSIKL